MPAKLHGIRCALTDVLAMVPRRRQNHPSVRRLRKMMADCVYDIVHLIYRSKYDESHAKGYEFSLLSMEHGWTAAADARTALARPDWLRPPEPGETVRIHDPLRAVQKELPQVALGRRA